MNLVRLIYASRFTANTDIEQIESIIEISRKKNPRQCITGVLCYGPGMFLQCLEGPRDAVNGLYGKIVNDSRNTDVTLLQYSEINERTFSKWTMAYARADEITKNLLLKFNAYDVFDPYSMNASQALGFIRGLLEEKDRLFRTSLKDSPAHG
jgi:hypothetical protein